MSSALRSRATFPSLSAKTWPSAVLLPVRLAEDARSSAVFFLVRLAEDARSSAVFFAVGWLRRPAGPSRNLAR